MGRLWGPYRGSKVTSVLPTLYSSTYARTHAHYEVKTRRAPYHNIVLSNALYSLENCEEWHGQPARSREKSLVNSWDANLHFHHTPGIISNVYSTM